MSIWRKALLTIGISLTSIAVMAQTTSTITVTSQTTTFSPGITGEVERVVAGHKGIMAVYCRNLDTGETIAINSDEVFQTASTIKTAMMCAVFDLLDRGEGPFKSYYDKMTYDEAIKAGGSGIIQNYKDGTKLELKELVHLMITVSDNTGTNMIGEWTGLEAINDWLEKNNFKETRIYATIGGHIVADAEGREKWGLGKTTPREMAEILVMIAEGKVASQAATEEMLRVLGHQYFDSNIPGGVPPTTWVGAKSGSLSALRADTALINGPSGMYVLSIFTKENEDKSWSNSNEGQQNIRKVSNLLWNHFNPDHTYEIPEGADKF